MKKTMTLVACAAFAFSSLVGVAQTDTKTAKKEDSKKEAPTKKEDSKKPAKKADSKKPAKKAEAKPAAAKQ